MATSRSEAPLFRRILIANRGEIALRVMRTAREMGIETVAVYSDADRNALHVRRADRAVCIGEAAPSESYLRGDHILEVAKAEGAEAIHPGYGFLSENAQFAEACAQAGIAWIGPPASAIRLMGDKVEARKAAEKAGVPLVPGLQENVSEDDMLQRAEEIGFPVMLKAAAGGGGKGIRIVRHAGELVEANRLAKAEARSSFGDDRVYLEKFVTRPRHVEIQVMADTHGNVVHYGERECSVQRRHQKLVEESPCVALDEGLRQRMGQAACDLSQSVGYVGAGTVEFLYSGGEFYFLEMNTRLQVEHPITEECYDVDLVREQLRVAAGLELEQPRAPRGHAIEVRINAEDPDTFFPSLGTITRLAIPGGPGVRMDAALYRGLEVTPHYDSMVGKLIVRGFDRANAIARMTRALQELRLVGIATSAPVALRTLESEEFVSGDYDTAILERLDKSTPEDTVELAALAAALSRFQRTEESVVTAQGSGATQSTPLWPLMQRVARLGRMAR